MWPYKYQEPDGLVHIFPPFSLLTPSFFSVSLSPTVGIPCLLYSTSDPEVIKSQDSSLRDITLYPDWFRRTHNTASFFFQSFYDFWLQSSTQAVCNALFSFEVSLPISGRFCLVIKFVTRDFRAESLGLGHQGDQITHWIVRYDFSCQTGGL